MIPFLFLGAVRSDATPTPPYPSTSNMEFANTLCACCVHFEVDYHTHLTMTKNDSKNNLEPVRVLTMALTRIHEVDFGKDADGPVSLGVHLPCHLEGVAVGKVSVGRRYRQNDGVGVLDVLHAHASDLIFNVRRLVSGRNLSDKKRGRGKTKNRINLTAHNLLDKNDYCDRS